MAPQRMEVVFFFHLLWTVVRCCKVPPGVWCDNVEIAKECNVLEQCSSYNSSMYKQKVKLTVIYEALCPACEEFLSTTLYNITWLQWEGWQFIDLELVPYGNAHSVVTDDGSYQISCQHGSDECWLNKLHSCVMSVLVNANVWLPVISCMEKGSSRMRAIDAADQCLKWPMVSHHHRHLIWACQNGSYGDELQKRAADRTDALWPDQHARVPWIVVNGASLHGIQYLCDYGHREPILYYALRHWFRGGRDPKANKIGAKPIISEEDPVLPLEQRRCVGSEAMRRNCK